MLKRIVTILLIVLLALLTISLKAQLSLVRNGDHINLIVNLPTNLTASYHTFTYIREYPYAEWYSAQTNKWLPYINTRYKLIITGVDYEPNESVRTRYTIESGWVSLNLVQRLYKKNKTMTFDIRDYYGQVCNKCMRAWYNCKCK